MSYNQLIELETGECFLKGTVLAMSAIKCNYDETLHKFGLDTEVIKYNFTIYGNGYSIDIVKEYNIDKVNNQPFDEFYATSKSSIEDYYYQTKAGLFDLAR